MFKKFGFVRLLFFVLCILQAGLQVHGQNFVGTYRGNFSGDWEGTFEFAIKELDPGKLVRMEGKFIARDGTTLIIYGFVNPKGVIEAVFYDNESLVTTSIVRGNFKGNIAGKSPGVYDIYDAARGKISRGDWTMQTREAEEAMFSFTYVLGKDLLIPDTKPIALRIHIRLNDKYKDKFSIQIVTLDFSDPEQGRYPPYRDPIDNFYVYTDMAGVVVRPPSKAKEVDYDFPYISFGNKPDILLPKSFTAKMHITLKSETGEKNREEVLVVPVQITSLCNVVVQKCASGECPTLNNKKLNKGQTGAAVSGDELVIPMDAELWIKFLDGTESYFANKSQTSWRLTLKAGHFSSSQSWSYTENAITIQALAAKGIESGGDKLLEEGLQVLMRKSASVATPGLILQLSQLFGANVTGGELVAIRVRSKLDIMFYADGTYRVRNLEGSPEVWRKKSTPLKIPVGKEVSIDKKGLVSNPVTIPIKPSEPLVRKKTETVNWQGTWQTQWGAMTFEQNGNIVTGTYVHDNGKFKGMIKGNTLTGTWSEAPTYLPPKDAGAFEFILSPDARTFTGRWLYGYTGDWQTGWDGHR